MPKKRMDKLEYSMKISTISDKKNRFLRLGFTRHVVQKFGVNEYTTYGRLRRGIFSKWMLIGIRQCICQYLKDDTFTDFEGFYESLAVKSEFIKFMSSEMGMCERTARSRFKNFDFNELELIGLDAAYEEFIDGISKRNGDR